MTGRCVSCVRRPLPSVSCVTQYSFVRSLHPPSGACIRQKTGLYYARGESRRQPPWHPDARCRRPCGAVQAKAFAEASALEAPALAGHQPWTATIGIHGAPRLFPVQRHEDFALQLRGQLHRHEKGSRVLRGRRESGEVRRVRQRQHPGRATTVRRLWRL